MEAPQKGKIQSLKRKSLNDLFFFGHDVLGYKKLIPELHGQWTKRIQDEVDVDRFTGYRELRLAFRGSYKSSVYSVSLPLWLLAKNPNLRILCVNEIEDNAIAFVKEQQSHILRNAYFQALFGEWYTRGEFSDDHYVVSTRTAVIGKEPSVQAAGMESTLVSAHYDVIIIDDLVGKRDRDSPVKRLSTQKFYEDIFALLQPNGYLFMIGTRWHKQDQYNHVEVNQNTELRAQGLKTFHVEYTPAVREAAKGEQVITLGAENYTATFPTIKNNDDLRADYILMGTKTFSAQMKLSPLSDEDKIFKKLHYFDINTLNLSVMSHYGYADYSAGKKQEQNDFAAVLTGVRDKDGSILIVDADIARRPVSETNSRILMKQSMKPYQEFGLEDDTLELTGDDMKSQSTTKGLYLSFKRRPTAGLPNKIARINAIEGLVTSGVIKFRKDWKTAPNNYYLLIEQLEEFGNPKVHDDGPDTLEGLIWLMRSKGIRFGWVGAPMTVVNPAANQAKQSTEEQDKKEE